MRKELLIAALGIGTTGALDAATRQEVERLLAQIAKDSPKEQGTYVAMCYSAPIPPERVEYVCPVCGTKTLYSRDEGKSERQRLLVFSELSEHRRRCETLRKLGWKVKLDESFLCSKCRKPEQNEEFFIEVTIDGKTTRTKLEQGDLTKLVTFAEKLVLFAEKKPLWEEHPKGYITHDKMLLHDKNALPRIRELLGVSEEKK